MVQQTFYLKYIFLFHKFENTNNICVSLDNRNPKDKKNMIPDDKNLMGELKSKKNVKWDQFSANKELFNVQSTYREDMYTTKLNMENMNPDLVQHATTLAAEMEGKNAGHDGNILTERIMQIL